MRFKSNIDARCVGPLLIAAAFIAMAAMTWMAWIDPVVDMGRELYVPWRITEGDVLYRDIAYFNGPLSPYLNALAFALFGSSLRTLVMMNLVIIAAAVTLAYRLIAPVAGRAAATAAGVSFVGLFAFARYTPQANFAWIAPYSHEITHGTLLGLCMLAAYARWRSTRRLHWMVCAGVATGLALLTKIEVAAAVGATLILMLLIERKGTLAAAAIAGAVAPLLVTWIAFAQVLPPADAASRMMGAWRYMLDSSHHVGDQLIAGTIGVDHPWLRLAQMAAWFAIWGVIIGVCLTGARSRAACAGAAGVLIAAAIGWRWSGMVGLEHIARPLPIAMVWLAVACIRKRDAFSFVATAFCLLLLMKVMLNARWNGYSFALAAPATLAAFAAVTHLTARNRRSLALWVGVIAFVVTSHAMITLRYVAQRTVTLGQGGDAMVVSPNDEVLAAVLDYLDERAAPGQTLAVMPEGVMLNYLSRMPVSTRYINFIPHEVNLYGESRIVSAFDANPPDWVIFLHRDTAEYGPRFFARDYATDLAAWVVSRYNAAHLIGAVPFEDDLGGVMIFRRQAKPRVE